MPGFSNPDGNLGVDELVEDLDVTDAGRAQAWLSEQVVRSEDGTFEAEWHKVPVVAHRKVPPVT